MEYLRLLCWLKWKLTLRRFQCNTSALVGAALSLLFLLPMSLGIAIGSGYGYFSLSSPDDGYLLRAVFSGIGLIWLLMPLIGFALNESYDITKLYLFPISPRQIFVGALLGSIIDIPVLMLLPSLLAVQIAFTTNVLNCVLILLVLGLFFFQTLAMSQAVLMLSINLLRSRRYRDLMMIIFPLLGGAYYFTYQWVTRYAQFLGFRRFLEYPAWKWVNYLPSGLAARSIAAANRGEYLVAVLCMLALALIASTTIYLAGWIVNQLCIGEMSESVRGKQDKKERRQPAAEHSAAHADRWLRVPPVVAAVFDKEIKYYLRDPAFKSVAASMLYMVVVMCFVFLRPHFGGGATSTQIMTPGKLWVFPGLFIFFIQQLTANIFGNEGSASVLLFAFPASRRQMMIGKNVALFLASSMLFCAFLLGLSALAHAMSLFPLIMLITMLGLAVTISGGNIVSVYYPYRAAMPGRRFMPQQQSSGRGCLVGLISLAMLACSGILSVPVILGIMLPYWLHATIWWALAIPLAVGYVVVLYLVSLRIIEPVLLQKELDIATQVSGED